METISQTISQIVTQASSAMSQDAPPESTRNEKPQPQPRQKPLETIWQRKWLNLDVTHPDVQKLASEAQAFAEAWFHRKPGKRTRIIFGRYGTGKTHVARCLERWTRHVAYEAWLRAWKGHGSGLPRVVIVDWSQVASPEKVDQREWAAWMEDVEAASMVILDDVGTETDVYKSGIPTERLCHVLNRCVGKFVWINTNIGPIRWTEKWDARVEDRLLAGKLIEVNAPSYRSEV